ncbi:hypothetical protein Tco_0046292 [Tanacetum coccineum]
MWYRRITYDCHEGEEAPNRGEKEEGERGEGGRFKKFTNNSGIIGGERFWLQPILISNDCPTEYIFVPSWKTGTGPIKSMTTCQRFRKLG